MKGFDSVFMASAPSLMGKASAIMEKENQGGGGHLLFLAGTDSNTSLWDLRNKGLTVLAFHQSGRPTNSSRPASYS